MSAMEDVTVSRCRSELKTMVVGNTSADEPSQTIQHFRSSIIQFHFPPKVSHNIFAIKCYFSSFPSNRSLDCPPELIDIVAVSEMEEAVKTCKNEKETLPFGEGSAPHALLSFGSKHSPVFWEQTQFTPFFGEQRMETYYISKCWWKSLLSNFCVNKCPHWPKELAQPSNSNSLIRRGYSEMQQC